MIVVFQQLTDFRRETVYSVLEMAPKRELVLAIVSFVISAYTATSQTVSVPAKDDLYSLALQASILQMEREWGHVGHSALDEGNTHRLPPYARSEGPNPYRRTSSSL